MRETGLIHVYYGNGKGKTTCGMGLCLRAAGAGSKVLIYQFMKDGRGHERRILESLPNVSCANAVRDISFSFRMSDEEKRKERERYQSELELVFERMRQETWDVLFLDEVLYAISCDLLPESVLTRFLDGIFHAFGSSRSNRMNVLYTYLGAMLIEHANTITQNRKRWNQYALDLSRPGIKTRPNLSVNA